MKEEEIRRGNVHSPATPVGIEKPLQIRITKSGSSSDDLNKLIGKLHDSTHSL